MTAETLLASLQLSIPELILAVGAMALLMIGVFAGEKSASTVTGLAVAVLIIAGLWLVLKTGEGEAYGGAFLSDSAFAAPYVYAIWPDSLDAFEYVVVTSPAAVVRTAPSASADTLGTASHSLLPYEDWRGVPESPVEPDTSWAGVLLPDGRTGWLRADDVHSPVGWRAIFERRDGRWMIVAFIAGD